MIAVLDKAGSDRVLLMRWHSFIVDRLSLGQHREFCREANECRKPAG